MTFDIDAHLADIRRDLASKCAVGKRYAAPKFQAIKRDEPTIDDLKALWARIGDQALVLRGKAALMEDGDSDRMTTLLFLEALEIRQEDVALKIERQVGKVSP